MSIRSKLGRLKILEVHNVGLSRTAVYLLADYLETRAHTLVHLAYPTVASRNRSAIYEVRGTASPARVKMSRPRLGPGYIRALAWYAYQIFRLKEHFDIMIAGDEMNAALGLLLKRMGFTNLVVFYSIDFHPTFRDNPLTNGLILGLGNLVTRHSDFVWNISDRCMLARMRQGGPPENCVVVPHGVSRIPAEYTEPKYTHRLVFAGSLTEEKGIQLMLEALACLTEEFNDVTFVVIGSGPFESQLKLLARQYGVEKHVEFEGFVKEDIKASLVRESAIAVATYCPPGPNSYLYYAFPAKLVEYLALGVPVVCTELGIAEKIRTHNAGVVVNYSKEDLVNTIRSLFLDSGRLEEMGRNALRLGAQYQADFLFDRGFVPVVNRLTLQNTKEV